ncbi:MAG: hypothetical protein WCA63_07940 [Gallionella sp.]
MHNENITIHTLRTSNGALVKYARRISSQKSRGIIVGESVMLWHLTPEQLQVAFTAKVTDRVQHD